MTTTNGMLGCTQYELPINQAQYQMHNATYKKVECCVLGLLELTHRSPQPVKLGFRNSPLHNV
eukprot:4765268-Amphidinium_carterae.1